MSCRRPDYVLGLPRFRLFHHILDNDICVRRFLSFLYLYQTPPLNTKHNYNCFYHHPKNVLSYYLYTVKRNTSKGILSPISHLINHSIFFLTIVLILPESNFVMILQASFFFQNFIFIMEVKKGKKRKDKKENKRKWISLFSPHFL